MKYTEDQYGKLLYEKTSKSANYLLNSEKISGKRTVGDSCFILLTFICQV